MGNRKLIELKQISATIQCLSCLKHVPEGLNMCQCGVWHRPNQSTMDRIRTACAALKTPYYRASVSFQEESKVVTTMATRSSKAINAKRRVLKRGKDRWQNDEVYRASQLVHCWTDEWVKYLDYISKIDISHDAPHRQRLRYESTVIHEWRRFQ